MKPYGAEHFDHEVCRPFFHRGDGSAILLVHGFTGSASHMRKLADALAARGRTVQTINLPGHALTEAEMAKTDRRMWTEAVFTALEGLRREAKTVTVCGLSMGGLLALIAAEQKLADGCITISAPMSTQNRLLPLSGIAAPFLPRIAWGSEEDRHPHLDKSYDYGYSGFPTAKGADLHRLLRRARRDLSLVTCPILCIQSEADATIGPESADVILHGVCSEVREKLWLTDVPHVCTISEKLPDIADAADRFLLRIATKEEQA